MTMQEFFIPRPDVTPTIYAYTLPEVSSHAGYIKIGYTERDVETRIKEQIGATKLDYKVLLKHSAMRADGSCFTDHEVHRFLKRKGFRQLNIQGSTDNEWFNCTLKDVQAAVYAVREGVENEENRDFTFPMRPEQIVAVNRTSEYFKRAKAEDTTRTPKFLWNAKMRFGKTFATYELAKKMGFKRILVLTFKPAVESAWREDLLRHVDFEGWQFVSNADAHAKGISIDRMYAQATKRNPIVVFGSFQDLLGTGENGGIKAKNEFIHSEDWDLVVFDEYHFGAWRENAKKLFEAEDEEKEADFDQEKYKREEADNAYNETFLPITTQYYLFLSGTPFRAINSGEFIEDQIFNWTYSDEQQAKENWQDKNGKNPYVALPRMVMLTYQVPEAIRQIAMNGEFNEFDLNIFFSARVEKGEKVDYAKFVYPNEVGKWLALIRGAYLPQNREDLKLGDKKPPMPYSDNRLLKVLNHTLWFLPNVASCYAMRNLLEADNFFRDYKIIVCAGPQAGIGLEALGPVQEAMENPLATKTITLSCGKLTTGVTVRPWTGVFMLRNMKSPETYFQTAFRVQSPWTITNNKGQQEIMKQECYVFDFALDRALRQISDYSCRLNIDENNPEKKVADFIHFLPVLAYDGATMKQINAQDVLDIALAGTSATLLARRWESALLVNVDNATLEKLLHKKEAMDALEKIEGFRALRQEIETIINVVEKIKKVKKDGEDLTPKEKKKLTEQEKELKSKRKMIQEKLIKFATRIPIFMYLTDYREHNLQEVIRQQEPDLFKKVTGLEVKDFELLVSLNVFNASLMNDAIFKFKRYEDASLSYTGIDKHEGEAIGGYDTTITAAEHKRLYFYNEPSGKQAETEIQKPFESVVSAYEEKPTKKVSTPVETQPASQSQTVASDYLATQVGDSVKHKAFGVGKVTQLDTKHIRVRFSLGEKLFIFPDAFIKGFLSR